jgi:hypothetical protein
MASRQYTEIFNLKPQMSFADREKFIQYQVNKVQQEMEASGFRYLSYQVNTASELRLSITFFYV